MHVMIPEPVHVMIPEPESKSIGELQYSSDILEIMRKILDDFAVIDRSSSLVVDSNRKDLDLDTECNFFPGVDFTVLNNYLHDSNLEDQGEWNKRFLYRVYDVPEKYTRVINAMRDVSCSRYHRVYLQTPDGIVNRDFGEGVVDSPR